MRISRGSGSLGHTRSTRSRTGALYGVHGIGNRLGRRARFLDDIGHDFAVAFLVDLNHLAHFGSRLDQLLQDEILEFMDQFIHRLLFFRGRNRGEHIDGDTLILLHYLGQPVKLEGKVEIDIVPHVEIDSKHVLHRILATMEIGFHVDIDGRTHGRILDIVVDKHQGCRIRFVGQNRTNDLGSFRIEDDIESSFQV